jgi:hypothetical protein
MTYIDIPEGDSDERRRYHRQLALIGVKLRRPGETWFTSRIADLTATGFRLHSFVTLTPGDTIWVMFSGFEGRRATVIWNKDYESGCIFERPLHTAVLDHIVRMS